jgi:hypothetical protein
MGVAIRIFACSGQMANSMERDFVKVNKTWRSIFRFMKVIKKITILQQYLKGHNAEVIKWTGRETKWYINLTGNG